MDQYLRGSRCGVAQAHRLAATAPWICGLESVGRVGGFKTGAPFHGRIVCPCTVPFSACLLGRQGRFAAQTREISVQHVNRIPLSPMKVPLMWPRRREKMSWDASTVHQGQHGSEMRPRSGFGSSKEHCHWRSSSENRHSLPDSFLGRGPGVRSQDCAAGGIGSFPPSGLPLGLPGPCPE